MSAGVDSNALLDAASGLLSSGDQMPTYDFETGFPESLGMYGDSAVLRLDVNRIQRRNTAAQSHKSVGVTGRPLGRQTHFLLCRNADLETTASAQDIFIDDPTTELGPRSTQSSYYRLRYEQR